MNVCACAVMQTRAAPTMDLNMKSKLITLLGAAGIFAFSCLLSTAAQANNHPPAKVTAKKKSSKKAEPAVVEETPDTKNAASADYQCELGNKLTIYSHADNDKFVALRWKNKLLQLTKVDTTTGASRYENKKNGLVWIGIPAKGMLLDQKKGQQLANECKTAEQMNPPQEAVPATATAEPAKS